MDTTTKSYLWYALYYRDVYAVGPLRFDHLATEQEARKEIRNIFGCKTTRWWKFWPTTEKELEIVKQSHKER